jgi:hypothetical protein
MSAAIVRSSAVVSEKRELTVAGGGSFFVAFCAVHEARTINAILAIAIAAKRCDFFIRFSVALFV